MAVQVQRSVVIEGDPYPLKITYVDGKVAMTCGVGLIKMICRGVKVSDLREALDALEKEDGA